MNATCISNLRNNFAQLTQRNRSGEKGFDQGLGLDDSGCDGGCACLGGISGVNSGDIMLILALFS